MGLWCPKVTTEAADYREDKLATASALIRPDGEISPEAKRPSGANKHKTEMETERLNAIQEGKIPDEEESGDMYPERGLMQGGSDGKGLGQEMATEEAKFTEDADTWAAGPQGIGGARMPGEEKQGEGEAEGEEGRQPVALKAPVQVTQAEREEHELTHTPFRAWCAHCVRGRGRNTPHLKKRESGESAGVPRISFDYFFMSWEDEAAHKNPMLVMKDESTGENTPEQ